MRLLAVAKPNKLYIWHQNLKNVTLEARLVNNKVVFYEIWDGAVRRISEKSVHNMFKPEYSHKDQPFLIKENREFYAVLNRHLKKYHSQYVTIKNKRK